VLYPKTNMNLVAAWKDFDKDEVFNRDFQRKDPKELHLCGKVNTGTNYI
jgi:hypothetical protein